MSEWHKYFHRAQGPTQRVLFLVALVVAFLWGGLQECLNFEVPWWLDAPAALGFYGLLFAVYDRYLWKVSWLVGLHGMTNYSGDFDLVLRSSHDEFQEPTLGTCTVRQTWSRVCVRLKTGTSSSRSVAAHMVEVPGEGHRLVYEYRNDPQASAEPGLHQHDGTSQILFSVDGLSGEGTYYTGRGRLNHGEFQLTKRTPAAQPGGDGAPDHETESG